MSLNLFGLDPIVLREDVYVDIKIERIGKRYANAGFHKLDLPEKASKLLLYWMARRTNFFIYLGNAGIGKTHLCAALVPWAMEYFNSWRYHPEFKIFEKLQDKISDGFAWPKELIQLIDDPLVMIDDVGRGKTSEFQKSVLTEIIDYRYNSMLPTIITSNLLKKDFEQLFHERVASRLFAKENLLIQIANGTDHRRE